MTNLQWETTEASITNWCTLRKWKTHERLSQSEYVFIYACILYPN